LMMIEALQYAFTNRFPFNVGRGGQAGCRRIGVNEVAR
jgi:hypothetical protein